MVYLRFGGKVSWKSLIEPSITLCEEGYPVQPHMAKALKSKREYILAEPSMRKTSLSWKKIWVKDIFIISVTL